MKRFVCVLAIVVLGMSAVSRADVTTLTDTQVFSGSAASRNFQIAKFDSALGTLNSVTITMSGSSVVTFKYTNMMDVPAVGNVPTYIAGAIKLQSDGVVLTTTPYSESRTISINLQPYETSTTVFNTIVATTANHIYLPGEFGNFIGATGNIPDLVISESTSRNYTGIGDNSASFTTRHNYSATVVYDFTPVPEPATLAVLGLGGLLLRRRLA